MKCNYCDCEYTDQKKLNHHLYTYHPREPGLTLTCGIRGCPATYTKFHSLTSHQSRKHNYSYDLFTSLCAESSSNAEAESYEQCTSGDNDNLNNDDIVVDSDTDDGTGVDPTATGDEHTTDEREVQAAKFIMSLRAKSNMSEKNVIDVLQVTNSMLADERRRTVEHISARLKEKGIDLESEISLDKVTSSSSAFKNLLTKRKQDNYFSTKFKVLEPDFVPLQRKAQLGRAKEYSNRDTVVKDDNMAYIALTKLIENILCSKKVPADSLFESLASAQENEEGVLGGYSDGRHFKEHEFFKAHPDGLQIVLYYDDVEICNPIGSRAGKHKLAMFYVTFLNVKPKYRSMLKSIHLVAIVNVNTMKECGVDSVLDVIVEDLKKLELGFKLSDGTVIYGCLVAFNGDNLGIHIIAGLKEGFTAFRLCRVCFLPIDLIRSCCCEDLSSLRTKEQFDAQVDAIEAATDTETRKALSTEYGINRRCALNSLLFYHTIDGLPLECMHDFLEGVLPLSVKLLLQKVCVKDKILTLDKFNQIVSDFDYGYSEQNKPARIKSQHLSDGGSLSQSASQMWLLSNILPLLIGDMFSEDDPYWENFIYLLEITCLVFAHRISCDMIEYLSEIIEMYLFTFKRLYRETLTPKQHFMTHYPRMILNFGPLIHFWVMRHEAKHQYFKRVARTINNWKNVPLSLCNQHELTQTWNYLGPIQKCMQVGETVETAVISLSCPPLFDGEQTVHVAPWVIIDGTKFVSGACYIALKQDIRQPVPKFAFLSEIIFSENEPVFVCTVVETVARDVHRAAYEIKKSSMFEKLKLESIHTLSVYHAHRVGLKYYIYTRQSLCDLY